MDIKSLESELKTLIIEALNLEDITPEEIDSDAPLFRDGLGLDSIDALELGIAIRRRYQVKLDAESEETRGHFASVSALARFIATTRG